MVGDSKDKDVRKLNVFVSAPGSSEIRKTRYHISMIIISALFFKKRLKMFTVSQNARNLNVLLHTPSE